MCGHARARVARLRLHTSRRWRRLWDRKAGSRTACTGRHSFLRAPSLCAVLAAADTCSMRHLIPVDRPHAGHTRRVFDADLMKNAHIARTAAHRSPMRSSKRSHPTSGAVATCTRAFSSTAGTGALQARPRCRRSCRLRRVASMQALNRAAVGVGHAEQRPGVNGKTESIDGRSRHWTDFLPKAHTTCRCNL